MIKHLACLAMLCLFPVLFCAAGPDTAPADSTTDGRYPTFGLALDNPDGWTQVQEISPENIGRWVFNDAKTGQPEALIQILVGRSGDGLIAYAQNLARTNGGTVAGDVQIDGERGKLVSCPGTAIFITKHGGLFYTVELHQGEQKHDKEFVDLANSIRWVDIESPIRHMELGHAFSAIGGSITIQVPVCMRPVAGGVTPTALQMVATDIVNRREFSVQFQSASINKNATPEDVRKTLLDGWNQKLQLKQPLVWKIDPEHPGCAMTSLVQVDAMSNDRPVKLGLQYGLVVDGKKAILLSFSVKDTPEDELDGYETAALSIMQSIKFNKPLK